MKLNLFKLFEETFSKNPEKVFLEDHHGTQYTYQDLLDRTAQFSNYLRRIGITKGDRVAVQVDKSVDCLFLYLACLRAGIVYLPLNPAYQDHELNYFCEDAKPSLFVCQAHRIASIQGIVDALAIKHLETLESDKTGSLLIHARSESSEFVTAETDKDDIAVILYTSGTTGNPKGAMLSHMNLATNGEALVDAWEFKPDDVLLHTLPIYHVHGLFFATHCTLLSSASMIFLPKFDVETTLTYLSRSTVMMGIPTYYTRLLKEVRFNRDACKRMRLFTSGSAPLLEKTFYEFEEKTGVALLERYGMTETGVNTSNPLRGTRKPGAVGYPLPNSLCRVVDDADQPVELDEPGSIQVKGDNVFLGYWNKADKTAESFTQDKFFKTGDIGTVDADGYISIIGREKDMIISGGLNVYPKEVELTIDKMDGISESAVIGIPHDDFGEAVVAVVVKKPGSTVGDVEIIGHVKSLHARFKAPKKVFFVDELPRNAMSKVQKNFLRDEYKSTFTPSEKRPIAI